LASLCERFGPPPAMKFDRFGYGAGQRDLPGQPNLLRLIVGEIADSGSAEQDQVVILETNLDDISGELIGHTIAQLWESGALDVYTTPIQMKKQRPGVTLTAIGRPQDADALEAILFRETTTLGIRRFPAARSKLNRETQSVSTPWGAVQGVVATLGDARRFSPEYESCRQIAEQHHVPLRAVYEAAQTAWCNQS
jgi:pyridinium-3,5-bisthiocarboxylic acid mononucleotide nickel chelatase